MLTTVIRGTITLDKGKEYEVVDIIQGDYIVLVPMKQKGKHKRVLVKKDEGELIED